MSLLTEVYTAARLQADAVLDTAEDLVGLPIDIYYPITSINDDLYGYNDNLIQYNTDPDINGAFYFITGIYNFQLASDETYDQYGFDEDVYLWDKGGAPLIPRGSKVVVHLTDERYMVFETTPPPDIIPGNDNHVVRRYKLIPKSGIQTTITDDSGDFGA